MHFLRTSERLIIAIPRYHLRGSAPAAIGQPECPLYPQSGHSDTISPMAAFDPKRTLSISEPIHPWVIWTVRLI
jgi:hypothetical protein